MSARHPQPERPRAVKFFSKCFFLGGVLWSYKYAFLLWKWIIFGVTLAMLRLKRQHWPRVKDWTFEPSDHELNTSRYRTVKYFSELNEFIFGYFVPKNMFFANNTNNVGVTWAMFRLKRQHWYPSAIDTTAKAFAILAFGHILLEFTPNSQISSLKMYTKCGVWPWSWCWQG